MKRKPQIPNWSRLARSVRVKADLLPSGSERDALIARARRLEAAHKKNQPRSR